MYPRNTPLTSEEKEKIRELYLKVNNQRIVAEMLGHSVTTVCRTIKEYGLNKGIGGNQKSQIKISDEQLIEESKKLSCLEIARKYQMSSERVYRRAQKLGISINSQNCGGHYRFRSKRYGCSRFDDSITLKKVRAKYSDICQICGNPVDDKDIENGHIKRLYPTIDHIIPLSKGGTHTWNNVQLAHMCCNAGKCDKVDNTVKREEVWT